MRRYWLFLLFTILLNGCVEENIKPHLPATASSGGCRCVPEETLPPLQIPEAERYVPPPPGKAGEVTKGNEFSLLRKADWSALPNGFAQDNLAAAWSGLQQSCNVLKKQDNWRSACEALLKQNAPSSATIRTVLREQFVPYQVINPDGSETGLITGYYEPLLKGSRTKSDRYRYPLYTKPDDLITIDLGSVYPELANRRLRGKLVGNKVIPYYNRGEIEITQSPLAGKELIWVDDIVDLFFLQIQGSGYIMLENGDGVHVGYADQNGQPYQSIGKILIDRGEISADKASMQGIKEWARKNTDKLRDLLNSNPSYVFFRELPGGISGPPGALGVPLTAERSIAVDPRYIPLGAPVFLSTTLPNSNQPLQRLMLAQDTGGAIKGAIRADFFWGAGDNAGRQAGAMKQRDSKMWVLLPKGFALNGQ
jgi:membrane-bound lytic murein transglycosylase A